MKTEQYKAIGMSLALASVLALGTTGCGGSSDNGTPATVTPSTATDVTVERGKVYDANVTDSSTPAQVATQKIGKNVYTFAKAPTYPVVVNGGWIDVNGDGKQGTEDVPLDIQMKSYTTTVTPITTYVADANKTIRKQKLEALAAELNANGVGEDANVTVEDLLKVPSDAPSDVMITANAIYKDYKEHNSTTQTDNDAVLSQFSTIEGYVAVGIVGDAKVYEEAVMQNLINQNLIKAYTQAYIDSLTPTVTPPVTDGGDTTTGSGNTTTSGGNNTAETTLPDLSTYNYIVIYKNVSQAQADSFVSVNTSNNTGYEYAYATANCEDFGFTSSDILSQVDVGQGALTSYSHTDLSTLTIRQCSETDYSGITYLGGNLNFVGYHQ